MKYLDENGLSHLWTKIKEKVPTKTSELINDSGFLTEVELTQEQLEGIANAVVEAQKVDIVNNVEEMIDTTKQYVLSTTGTIWEYKEVNTHLYTNLFKPEECIINKRYTSSGTSDVDGYVISNAINITGNYNKQLRLYGGILKGESGLQKIAYYNNIESSIVKLTPSSQCNIQNASENELTIQKFTIGGSNKTAGDSSTWTNFNTQYKYIQLSFYVSSSAISEADLSNIIITVDEEIKDGMAYKWVDTGVLYSGGVSEERVKSIEEGVTNLDTRLSVLESSEDTDTIAPIPTYWQESYNEAITKVKGIQDSLGKDCFNFIWFSDIHIKASSVNHAHNLGILSAHLTKDLNIPCVMLTGDNVTNAPEPTKEDMVNDFKAVNELLAPIDQKFILNTNGNHDGAWGISEITGNKLYYIFQFTNKEIYNCLFRKQAMQIGRHFGPDGTYFYVDYIPQKMRVIMLNSFWNDDERLRADGSVVYDGMHNGGFGQNQLSWLCEKALNVKDDDWGIIIGLHEPIYGGYDSQVRDIALLRGILCAYGNKGVYTGSYNHNGTKNEQEWANVSIDYNFATYKGKLFGIFSGHCHSDNIHTEAKGTAMPCPMLTINCGTNSSYDPNEKQWLYNNGYINQTIYESTSTTVRPYATSGESLLDIVSIDKVSGNVYLTRLGVGEDREISY